MAANDAIVIGGTDRLPLLQQRPFRMLSYTRFTSRLAQNALNFALVLLIVDETGKAFLSSLLVLALVVPSTVAGIVAGTAADALPKRLLVVIGDLLRAFVCILFITGSGSVISYYVVAVALATATQFATNAEGAILPAVVDRAELTRANAISHAVGGAAQLLGLGVLTPVVLRLVGHAEVLFGVCAALFVLALIAVAAPLFCVAVGSNRQLFDVFTWPGSEAAVWHRVFEELAQESDLEEVFLDSPIVRVHQPAAWAFSAGVMYENPCAD